MYAINKIMQICQYRGDTDEKKIALSFDVAWGQII